MTTAKNAIVKNSYLVCVCVCVCREGQVKL